MDINADRKGGTGMSWEHCTQKPKNNHAFLSHVLQTVYARKVLSLLLTGHILLKECVGERKAKAHLQSQKLTQSPHSFLCG